MRVQAELTSPGAQLSQAAEAVPGEDTGTNEQPPPRGQLEECMNCQEHSRGMLPGLPGPCRTGSHPLAASGKPRFRSAWKEGCCGGWLRGVGPGLGQAPLSA